MPPAAPLLMYCFMLYFLISSREAALHISSCLGLLRLGQLCKNGNVGFANRTASGLWRAELVFGVNTRRREWRRLYSLPPGLEALEIVHSVKGIDHTPGYLC